MATTKRASSSGGKSGTMGGMSVGVIIIAAILSFLLFVVYISKPNISVVKDIPTITQGILAPAILVGVVLWALVEYSTPPGKGIWVLLERAIPALIVGGFVGGYLGYEFQFGAYILTPAFSGNMYAKFFLIVSFLSVFTLIWTVAWAHTHGFKGIRTAGSKPLGFSESGPSKVRRIMKAVIVIVVGMILLVPAGAELGHLAASGHQTNELGYDTASSQLFFSTQIHSVREFNSSSSISSRPVPHGFNTEFEMPTHDVKNKTGVEVSTFYQTAYITSALTTGNVNQYALSQISLSFGCNVTANITIGTGVAVKSVAGLLPPSRSSTGVSVVLPNTAAVFEGTNATTFTPVETVHMNDSMYANFTLQPDMFLANQSLSISYEIQGNLTTDMYVIPIYTGNPSGITVFWPYDLVQAMYILGGVLLLIFIPVSIPMIDLNTGKMNPMAYSKNKKNGGRK